MGENVFNPAAAGTASEHSSQTGRPSPETSARAGSTAYAVPRGEK
jgi:hypothetical protein